MISCGMKIRKQAVKNIPDNKIIGLIVVLKQMYQNLTYQDFSALKANDLSSLGNKLEKKMKVSSSNFTITK